MNIISPDKTYRKNNHTVFSCQYHVIFCPKFRRNVLVGQIASYLKETLYKIALKHKAKIIECEIMPDHVHILIDVDPDIGVKKTVARLKGASSHELRLKFPELKRRLPSMWTNSKFISTVGSVSLDIVKKYIENQKGK